MHRLAYGKCGNGKCATSATAITIATFPSTNVVNTESATLNIAICITAAVTIRNFAIINNPNN